VARERTLVWDGCLNVRDLGGHPTEDGGETVFGAVVRADSIRRLSDEGWAALVDYGVRTVVDLRQHSELEADPPRELPVDVVHVPLFGSPDPTADYWAEMDELAEASGGVAAGKAAIYLDHLERFRSYVRDAIEAVARAPEGAVLVHCQVGKDRTGLVTALLLGLAGVGREEIAADYALSEELLRPLNEPYVAAAEDEAQRAFRERMIRTPAEAMTRVLDALEERHGAVPGYLRWAGLAEADVARAAARLRRNGAALP
jgi:protein tyrosine/serine phosphatase